MQLSLIPSGSSQELWRCRISTGLFPKLKELGLKGKGNGRKENLEERTRPPWGSCLSPGKPYQGAAAPSSETCRVNQARVRAPELEASCGLSVLPLIALESGCPSGGPGGSLGPEAPIPPGLSKTRCMPALPSTLQGCPPADSHHQLAVTEQAQVQRGRLAPALRSNQICPVQPRRLCTAQLQGHESHRYNVSVLPHHATSGHN